MRIRVLCWNIRHGGGSRIERIHGAIRTQRADVIVLTEFRDNPAGAWLRDALAEDGWPYQASSAPPPRANGVLIAARRRFRRCAEHDDVPPDRHRWVTASFSRFGITGTYFPSLHEKVPHWEYMCRTARRLAEARHLIVGDTNTGKNYIDEAGTVFRYGGYLDAMAAEGWPEAWRLLHPRGRQYSWYSHKGNGFRIDHAYVSPRLIAGLRAARYSHRDRKAGTSDHSALIVELDV